MLEQYVIKNGTLVSILDGTEQKKDILVENGIITKIASDLEAPQAEEIDASGKYISVGWLDAHTHFACLDDTGIDAERDLLMQGITLSLIHISEPTRRS